MAVSMGGIVKALRRSNSISRCVFSTAESFEWASRHKGRECLQEIQTEEPLLMLFFLP